jgi:hypothetical protein
MQSFVTQSVYEDSAFYLMGRGKNSAAANWVQADFQAIDLKVYEQGKPATLIAQRTLTIADVIFNALQTDARWTKDATGYNFRLLTLPADVPDGSKQYVFEIKFTPTGGAPIFFGVFEVPTLDLHQS